MILAIEGAGIKPTPLELEIELLRGAAPVVSPFDREPLAALPMLRPERGQPIDRGRPIADVGECCQKRSPPWRSLYPSALGPAPRA